jgi:hypothetical protein
MNLDVKNLRISPATEFATNALIGVTITALVLRDDIDNIDDPMLRASARRVYDQASKAQPAAAAPRPD